ncbi:MAG: copper-translocating P-type ATPase [Synergistaceae bacterium]|nr:copper-translocating P-type ATPase [Synergistaceae bacterium]
MSEQYNITGMSCAACSARVERVVKKLPGVASCAVSLLTNSMTVEGTALPSEVIAAVEKAGYGAALKTPDPSPQISHSQEENALADHETPILKRRLISSLVFLLALMYFSMGHMLNLPLPSFFADNHVAQGIIQMLLAGIIMVINQKFFVSGFSSLLHLAPNMDTLVAMGSFASFSWSVYVLLMMTREHTGLFSMSDFYFESAGMILTLITVGKMLEARSKGRTTDALKSLMKLSPKTAVILRNNQEITVPIEQVMRGNVFVVRPGENIPVDGIIVEGSTAVNESALTGESIPVDKTKGDSVSAGTINQSGFIKCEATRVGHDTTLSQIIKMVSDAAATKAPVAKIADKVCGIFVPSVIFIAVCVVAGWIIAGKSFGEALSYGIAVLVISCPCALGLATPVAVMVGNGVGAKNGVLFKTASSLEETGKIKIAALDKTGTITSGEPKVTDILTAGDCLEEELVTLAYSLESKSEHPLAKAVVDYAKEKGIKAKDIEDFKALMGNGLTAALTDGSILTGGSVKFITEKYSVSDKFTHEAEKFAENGKTPLMFVRDDELIGIIAVADVIKPDSKEAVKELQEMGIKVVMLTGDNERTAKAIANEAGVDDVIAGVLPDGKESVIRKLQESGKTAMVGDGINDAPALTRADIGIAIGAGTDIAVDAADVVLMRNTLRDVPAAVRLSRMTLRNIHQNLFWAFIYNVIGIPLAAGLWGLKLDPMFGAAAMSLSSFCVVTNALRLNLFDIHGGRK